MRTSLSFSYSVRQAAWILGVSPSVVSRWIRVGTLQAAGRHGRRVVPASALVRLLGSPVEDRPGACHDE
nr:helix-turn-helix domain-containing protein [Kibdelosporangium sp. MJ126-NF4]